MLDQDTKRRIDTARQILVGKIPDPKAQVEQITTALIYKFMDDMDRENEELGGKAKFLTGQLKQYSWGRLLSKELSGQERMLSYIDALTEFSKSEQIPELFRTIFKGTFLPYRDPETLNLFLKEINGFTYDNSEELGNAFEYLLSILGSQGDAGQFRTPRHIIDFIVEVVDPKKTDKILDPACGTAGFLISAYKHIKHQNSSNFKPGEYMPSFSKRAINDVSLIEIQSNGDYTGDKLTPDNRKKLGQNIIGYDISPDMVRLSLVNMYLHGFNTPQIFEYDSLTYEDRWGDNFDIILANPPFMSPTGGIRPHKRFQIQANRSELLFVDYIAEHLTLKGRAGVIVPEGIIFQASNAYKNLRKMLIEDNYLWAVVSLPAGVFKPYSGVKTSILFFDRERAKKNDDILFIKVSNDGFDLGDQRRASNKNDLPEAYKILQTWQKDTRAESPLSFWVEKKAILESSDYTLTVDRYREAVIYSNATFPLVSIGELISTITPPKKIKSEHFGSKGKYPIIDQSQNMISGWSDDDKAVIDHTSPLVIFGDHTCSIKYIDFPFIQGADGIKILKTKQNLNARFIYYILKTGAIKPEGYKRHFSKLKRIKIPLPSLEVQNEIVTELDGYQRVIDGARQIVANWKPTIKIDPAWGMVPFKEVASVESGFGFPLESQGKCDQEIPFLKVSDMNLPGNETRIVSWNNTVSRDSLRALKAKAFPAGTVIFPKIGAAIATNKKRILTRDSTYDNNVMGIVPDTIRLIPEFLHTYLLSFDLLRWASDAQPPSMKKSVVEVHEIPLPPLAIQKVIVAEIAAEQKAVESAKKLIEIHEQKIKNKIAEVWGEER